MYLTRIFHCLSGFFGRPTAGGEISGLAFSFFLLAATAFAHADAISSDPALAASVQLPSGPLGSGKWRFEVEAGWAKVGPGRSLGPTHGGVVVDRTGNIYVSSDGPEGILVFSSDGKFLRGLAPELTGIHGLVLRPEGGREFIYAAQVKGNQVVKLGLDGAVIWTLGVPTESGLYKKKEEYKPTAVAVGPDGRIYVADGYGASVIHLYDAERHYMRTLGSKGTGDGQFKTCHGLAVDTRYGAPRLLVADRENRRLVHLDMEGNFIGTLTTDLRRPCAISFAGEFAAIAELEGRVVVTDRAGKIVATLGDNPDKAQWAKFKLDPEFWKDGIFVAPHGLGFDAAGNLYVQDWNFTGRLTKLRRLNAKGR